MKIIFLGPLPPPLHGFSAINSAMLERLQTTGEVTILNRAISKSISQIFIYRLIALIKLIVKFTFIVTKKEKVTLYVGISGGLGQIIDLPFLIIAKIFGARVFIHHHSFAYINKWSVITYICMKFSKKSTHITLCKTMADGLKKNYSLPENSISIISNAAFLKNPTATSGKTRWKDFSPNESVCIGFLSNITTSKGIFEYFETLKEIKAKKINFSAYIAGPIFEPEIMTKFKLELDDMPEVVYLGGIYGEAKTQFFHKIDILLFPTNYINEAEPVTIHEAMHEGVLVCAANRGCISKIIPADCGCTASFESFKKVAVETIIEFSKQDKILKATRRELIKNTAAKIWSESNEDLKKLVHKISIK